MDGGTASIMSTMEKILIRLIEEFEGLEQERKDLAERRKQVLHKVKAEGFDCQIFKTVVQRRARERREVEEMDSILQMYEQAIGVAR